MEGETDDKDYDDDDRQPAGEVDEVEVEGHLEGETWNNLRRRIAWHVKIQSYKVDQWRTIKRDRIRRKTQQ